MPTLRERMDTSSPATTLAEHIRQRIDERWQPVLDEHHDELEREFAAHADAAYRMYSRLLLDPVRADLEELGNAGYTVEPEFPGNFKDSVEPDTSPADRVRTFWSAVSHNGEPVGTLVYRMYHDHSQFRVWRAPEVVALEETSPEAVRAAVARM